MKRTLLTLIVLLLPGTAHAQAQLPKALSASELQTMSGGANQANIAVSSQTLSALNSGNQVNADTVQTGNIALESGAFNGFNGVGNFVFNTGNNNNLQGTLNVTVLAPAH
ncbi:MAG TPA: hypothetical protein VFI23_12265 [Rhizomicrobium sp.]|nr:hypothetical protein [Rhizomicrobium sp.]